MKFVNVFYVEYRFFYVFTIQELLQVLKSYLLCRFILCLLYIHFINVRLYLSGLEFIILHQLAV